MEPHPFLPDAYFDAIDAKAVYDFKDLETDEKVEEVIGRYEALSDEYPPELLDRKGAVPDEILRKLKAIEFFGLSIPREYGGLGFDLRQYLRVVEKISCRDMALAILCLAHLSIGTKGIVLYGNDDQKTRYLTPAARGEMIFAFALTEPKTGSDAKNLETSAFLAPDRKHNILNGQKTYITNAKYAGGLTVFAQMDPGRPGFMGAFIVETSWEGVKVGRDMPKMGLKASSTAPIQFRDVRVPVDNLLGKPGDGFKIAMQVLNYGRLALGAASAGMMAQSFEDMKKRAAGRRQFGVPIDRFELIQEKMVKAKVHGYVASAMTAFTAGMLTDNPGLRVAVESSHCKLFGTTQAWDTLYDALQTAGGAGYLSTLPYEKRMRDFRVSTVFEGTTEIHSIYPALYLLNLLSKRMRAAGRRKPSQVAFLLKGLFRRTPWRLHFKAGVMGQAARFARSSARRIRFMLYAGSLLYGKRLVQKQFFLRRITLLSLYFYGLICVLAKLQAVKKTGRGVGEELIMLGYFLEEARQSRKRYGGFFPSRLEILNKRIMEGIREREPMG
ncbi:MAG: acyl-CoA dehydrogenase family protein [Deltaproteobacteria bacterium]